MKSLLLVILSLWCMMTHAQTPNVKVAMRNGTVITGEIVEFDPLDHIKLKLANSEITIPMKEVAYVDNINPTGNLPERIDAKDTAKIVDNLADYKGLLLAKGNNVYIYSENEEYETAGAKELKSLLKKEGFWNVVDNMIDAHFTIGYIVDLRGHDKAFIHISSWRSEKAMILCISSTDESVQTNRRLANEMYNKHIVPFQKKIEKGSISKSIKRDFTM